MSIKYKHIEYNDQLYQKEIQNHASTIKEYEQEIYQAMSSTLETNKPNLELYQQQPYLTNSIRAKLIEFLIKMSIRLKILPFVVFRAIKIFDRYCSKRIILLDQSQLIVTTCLWIAAKLQGGNNHFINLNNLDKLSNIKTINDLGYGSGGKYLGPTERFRLPKLHELIKLCGNKCKYDMSMFKQMELHILSTLEWNFNDPSIEEFLIQSTDFNVLNASDDVFKIKEYLTSVSLYSFELIDCNILDLSKVMVDLINEMLDLTPKSPHFQTINQPTLDNDNDDEFFIEGAYKPSIHLKMDFETYKYIKKYLIKAVLHTSDFLLNLFDTKGPQYFYNQVLLTYRNPFHISKTIIPDSLVIGRNNKPNGSSISSAASTNTTCSTNSNNSCFTYANSMHSPITPMSSSSNISPKSGVNSGINTNVPSAVPPQIPTPPTPTSSSMSTSANPHGYIYKPIPVTTNSNPLLKKYSQPENLTKLSVSTKFLNSTTHQHNNSQASLTSAGSRDTTDTYSIFEMESRKFGVYTPMSDDESPVFSNIKQFSGIPFHPPVPVPAQIQGHANGPYKFA